MARILILIGGHLCTAPRPQKEAETLFAAGHDVTVSGLWHDPELVERDRSLMKTFGWRFVPVVDSQPESLMGRMRNVHMRGRTRLMKTSKSG